MVLCRPIIEIVYCISLVVSAQEILFNFIPSYLQSRGEDVCRRSFSNVRRTTSRVNHTDGLRDIQNDNTRIGMSELRYRMTEN